ncbi:TonB-dependent receptor [Methylomonas koyamae]|uniref:TonB-dependent receptor n=1 Tax=Methylomonas koyamae TaxID=702114 RepID=A0A177N7I3_9GAMM|nr:TonB-dependent receptor [Methylomonas koyamae]OAI13986.1 TonB-dependent receptor [Methylomonas koyamae]
MKSKTLLLVAGLLASPSILAEASQTINIPTQPLANALEQFSLQTGLQVLYSGDAVAGKTSQGVSGQYSPRQALERLIGDSGLAFQIAGNRTVTIRDGNSRGAEKKNQPVKLEPIVVTATKTERLASEVPATVAVVEAKQIENMYSRDSGDLLTRSAGIDIARSGTSGISTLNIRGTGSRRSSVLVNGQYAEFLDIGIGNQNTLQTIDWDNIERLEVVRGAGSALYGPNAMGGVVNVITKDAPEEKNVTRPFFVFDSLPTYGGGVSTGGTLDAFTYQLNFKHLNSDGYKASPTLSFYPGNTMTTTLSQQKGAWDRTMLGGKLGYKLSDRDKVNFAFNYMDESTLAFDRPHTPQNGSYGQYSLDFKHEFSDRFDVTTTVSHRSHVADLTWDTFFYPFTITNIQPDVTLHEDAQKLTGEIRGRWTPVDGHTLLFGYNAAQDWTKVRDVTTLTGAERDNRKANIVNHGLYLQYELELDKRLFVSMGGRYDWFDYDMDASITTPSTQRHNQSSFETFNPRGGIRYKFNDLLAIHGSIGTGFRAPDPGSMVGGASSVFVERLPNTGLQPETSDSYDLGIDIDTPFGLHAAATGFYNDISNYILVSRYRVGSKTMIQSQNLAKVQTYGAELELTQRLTDQLSLFTNYTHTIARTAADLAPTALGLPQNGYQLPNVPEHKASFGLVFESSQFSGRLEGRYVGNQFISGDSTNQAAYELPSYVVADINATYRYPIGNKKTLDVTAGINNIFDRQYEMRSKGFYNEPRVGFIRLGLEF